MEIIKVFKICNIFRLYLFDKKYFAKNIFLIIFINSMFSFVFAKIKINMYYILLRDKINFPNNFRSKM